MKLFNRLEEAQNVSQKPKGGYTQDAQLYKGSVRGEKVVAMECGGTEHLCGFREKVAHNHVWKNKSTFAWH